MRPADCVTCASRPCLDVDRRALGVPEIDVRLDDVRIVLISEAAPADAADGYFGGPDALFARTTIASFREAGADVSSMADILALGVYVTPSVKCAKDAYGISSATIAACAELLERELALFPNVRAYLLMGDVAIKAINAVAKRAGEPRVIPAGPTYRLRAGAYTFRGARAFPSYLQAGPSFFIEKGKHRVIAADIAAALALVR